MAWQSRWRTRPTTVPNVNAAPWRIDLPDKTIHGTRKEIMELARKHGINRIFDRQKKIWVSAGV